MAAGQETISSSTTIGDALLTKIPDDLAELFLIKTEVEDARDGEASLKAQIDDIQADIDALEAGRVQTTGNETIAGIKTFSSSPIVPTPTTDYQAATKKYVDDGLGAKQATITGAATTIDTEDLIASRVLASDASGKVAVSTLTEAALLEKLLGGKVVSVTFDLATASGSSLAVTGAGFEPTGFIVAGSKHNTEWFIGFYAGGGYGYLAVYESSGVPVSITGSAVGVAYTVPFSSYQLFTFNAFTSDGVVLYNTKYGTPSGTEYLKFMFFR